MVIKSLSVWRGYYYTGRICLWSQNLMKICEAIKTNNFLFFSIYGYFPLFWWEASHIYDNYTFWMLLHFGRVWLHIFGPPSTKAILFDCWFDYLWPNTTKGTSCLFLKILIFLHYLTEDFTSFRMIPNS